MLSCQCLFALLESSGIKAAHKMLVKLTPGRCCSQTWFYIAAQKRGIRLICFQIFSPRIRRGRISSHSEISKTNWEKNLYTCKFDYCYLHTNDAFSSKNQNIWCRESKVIQIQIYKSVDQIFRFFEERAS